MFQEAEAVLVLNPITAALLEPFARRVCVVPWGIDPERFARPNVIGLEDGTDGDAIAVSNT